MAARQGAVDPDPALQQRTDHPQTRTMSSQGMKGAESYNPPALRWVSESRVCCAVPGHAAEG